MTEVSTLDPETLSPSQALEHIQKLFKQWGIYDRKLTLDYAGVRYAFSCGATAFIVYRLLPAAGTPPGSPGWPVCLVTAEGIIDECSGPVEAEDFFACSLRLADWLGLIQQLYGPA